MTTEALAWVHHWSHRFSKEVFTNKRDVIYQDPKTGETAVHLRLYSHYGDDWTWHGPFASVEEAIPCTESRCECWKRKRA
jgi:hypothetical protein